MRACVRVHVRVRVRVRVCVCRKDLIATLFERDCRLYSVEGLFAMGSALKRVVTHNFSNMIY